MLRKKIFHSRLREAKVPNFGILLRGWDLLFHAMRRVLGGGIDWRVYLSLARNVLVALIATGTSAPGIWVHAKCSTTLRSRILTTAQRRRTFSQPKELSLTLQQSICDPFVVSKAECSELTAPSRQNRRHDEYTREPC